jgi:hypothetical protein
MRRRAGAAESQEQFFDWASKEFPCRLCLSMFCAGCNGGNLQSGSSSFYPSKKILPSPLCVACNLVKKTTQEYSGNFENLVFFAKQLPLCTSWAYLSTLESLGPSRNRGNLFAGDLISKFWCGLRSWEAIIIFILSTTQWIDKILHAIVELPLLNPLVTFIFL